MEYLKGYTVKPSGVTETGDVLFTDGTNEVLPNQLQCEAYGYTYNNASSTCSAYRINTNLPRNVSNINNRINGPGNTTELGTNTVQINGTNNTTKGFNNNCLISGSDNKIANGVNNAVVVGSNGEAIRDGEFVIGSADGIGQTSTFSLNGTTTNATSTALFINGDTAVTTIARNADTVYYYTIDIHAYRTGGASGSGAVGDRAFYTLHGIVQETTDDEVLTTNETRGTVIDWAIATAFVGTDLQLKATGVVEMNIQWTATAKFYAMKI